MMNRKGKPIQVYVALDHPLRASKRYQREQLLTAGLHGVHLHPEIGFTDWWAWARAANSATVANASNVLIVDDGSTKFADELFRPPPSGSCAAVRDQRAKRRFYTLDPRIECVMHGRMTTAQVIREAGQRPIWLHPFSDLPEFDLVVVGCHQFDRAGFLYSWHYEFRVAFMALQGWDCISDATPVVLAADPKQMASHPPPVDPFSRARFWLTDRGLHLFDWRRT